MFKTDIIFSGYYGMKNTGDDAFVEIANWGSSKFWGVESKRFLAKEGLLPKTLEPVLGYPFSIPKTYLLQRKWLLHQTKYSVLAGGSVFNDVQPGSIKDVTLRMKVRHKRLKLGAIGVSIGPFKSVKKENEIIEYLKHMDFLSVRDKRSYEYASSLNLEYNPVESFDIAAMLPEIYNFSKLPKEKNSNIIGISFNNEESHLINGDLVNEKRRRTFIISLLRYLSNHGNYEFRFFVFNANPVRGDEAVTNEIIQKSQIVNYEIFQYQRSTINTWNALRECAVMISSRLHASIFACFADVPFFSIEYHKKCTDFLKDVGQDESYLWGDGEIDFVKAAQSVLSILQNDRTYIPPAYKEEMIEKARLNFTAFKIR
ncbi:polysaccharide pyruvyl transferase family protein [Flavobacteriaceae bacterium TP-CH-4]|uniref:Polysaccharide pyruvyl transferase family protein n=1 Tax=Pelagihabitans pacificus TaxID=2696054 RepID=A0A967ECC4_9FLAO|nr:polysaccharide pyruvyl transferase family protein [Pelagihabitans pacificus]NHF61081.1 polysaccharide pyruvyl transferase family protein [Pelagihabitans pacificus]